MTALIGALVHESAAASPALQVRHASFITGRLAISFAALAVAPFFLAFRGALTGAEAVVFLWSLFPLAAAVLLARTGRIIVAHGLCVIGLIGLGLSLWAVLGCGVGTAVAWFVVARLEAATSGDTRLVRAADATLAMAFAILFVATARGGLVVTGGSEPLLLLWGGLALAYALFTAPQGVRRIIAAPRPAEEPSAVPQPTVVEGLIDDVVVRFDASGSAEHVAASCESRLGLSAADLGGRGLFDHVHVLDRPSFLKLIADAAHGDEVVTATIRLRTMDARAGAAAAVHLWVELRARADGAVDGRPSVIAVLRNIEEARSTALEASAARQSIEDTVRSKDQFMANMSHELRTPLNAIIGFSEMLASHTLRPATADKQREYAKIILQSGQHLLSVVNSILDMSKLRSGTFTIVAEPFDVVPMIDACCDMIDLKAGEGRVELVRDYPKQLEEIVGDRRAYKQILLNLLSNAVKFTPEFGRVTVSVRPEGTSLCLVVGDTGCGIGAADLERLGDPFFQAGASLGRAHEGTGLGLSVVRGLVGLHGGTIAIESEPGRGTRVKVRLPLDCRVAASAGPIAPIEIASRRQAHDLGITFPNTRMKQIA